MNMLDDDRKKYSMGSNREQYVVGGLTSAASKLLSKGISKLKGKKTKQPSQKELETQYLEAENRLETLQRDGVDDKNIDEIESLREVLFETGTELDELYPSSPVLGKLDDDRDIYREGGGPGIEALRKKAPEVVGRMGYEEGGSLLSNDMTMMSENMEMDSDETMEKEYSNFIIGEALSEEEEDMLMSKLEQDEELQMLFDKVVDVAQEFAGEGPVEGPGSGVSDSIPARLSDGEFVFTAKAVEEIGEDVLMSMMKEAEDAAGEREGFNIGGTNMQKEKELLDEESNVSSDMRTVNPRLNPNTR